MIEYKDITHEEFKVLNEEDRKKAYRISTMIVGNYVCVFEGYYHNEYGPALLHMR